MPISAPYNFVPLSNKVFKVDWADKISMDIPFPDGEDGTICVKITNKSPLFVGNKRDENDTDYQSRHILMPDGTRRYYIPGTTLKGCFRSVMEILSFAQMKQYNDDSFGFRFFDTKIDRTYADAIKKATCCGWLRRKDSPKGIRYQLTPCMKGILPFCHSYIKERFPNFDVGKDHETAERKQASLGNELYPWVNVEHENYTYPCNRSHKLIPDGRYQLVCTGYMDGKKYEYLFSEEQGAPIEIEEKIFNVFDSVHKNTEYYGGKNGKGGFLKNRLENGEPIPVFFEKNSNGGVVSMGITAKYRYPYRYSVSDMVQRAQRQLSGVDLPEAIFGYIGDNQASLRGRVLIGNAFADNIITPQHQIDGVLGQPNASYYPLYLKQDGGVLQKYDSSTTQIAGRKRYRISQDFQTLPLIQGNGNENVMSHLIPLPANNTFTCKIRVHNLRKVEIGALLSAITFNQTPNTYHNIGMAKSFGYGIVSCEITELQGLQHDVADYINEFNNAISAFLQQNSSSISTEQSLKQLVSIASPTHTAEDMKIMDLEDYEYYKKNDNRSSLTETPHELQLGIDESQTIEKWKEQKENEAQQEETLLKQQQQQETKLQYEKFCDEAQQFLEVQNFDSALAKVNMAQNLLPQETRHSTIANDIAEAKKKQSLDAGIAEELNKKQNNGDFAVKSFKICEQKVDRWLKSTNHESLPVDQHQSLLDTLLRLKSSPDRNEKGLWDNSNSKLWMKVSSWVGDETTQKMFDMLHS